MKSLSVALCFFWITMLCSFTVLAELPWELAEGKWKGQSEKYRGGMMKVGMKFYATGKVKYMRSETLQFHTADDNRLWEGIWAKEPGSLEKNLAQLHQMVQILGAWLLSSSMRPIPNLRDHGIIVERVKSSNGQVNERQSRVDSRRSEQ